MKIIFITRCYKPTNLQAIKDNLKEVFYKQSEHSYVQYLLVDMSYGEKEQAFKCFEDEHTKTYFIYEKKDYYNNSGIDQLLKKINEDQNDWVYVLDDDNFINKDILKAFDSYLDEDVILVNSNTIKISKRPNLGSAFLVAVFFFCFIRFLSFKASILLLYRQRNAISLAHKARETKRHVLSECDSTTVDRISGSTFISSVRGYSNNKVIGVGMLHHDSLTAFVRRQNLMLLFFNRNHRAKLVLRNRIDHRISL